MAEYLLKKGTSMKLIFAGEELNTKRPVKVSKQFADTYKKFLVLAKKAVKAEKKEVKDSLPKATKDTK